MRKYLQANPKQKKKSDERWKQYNYSHKRKLREIVNRAKSIPCKDCNRQYNPWVMQFDHRNPAEKIDTIANLVANGKSLVIIQNEIKKCDVVCSNCHAERTHKQRINKEI